MGLLIALLWLIGGRGGDAVAREDPSGGTEALASAPQLVVAWDGAALVAWESRDGGRPGIRLARREPGSAGRWAAPQAIADGPAVEPRLAAGSPGHVQIVWLARTGAGYEVRTRRSGDGGRTWDAVQSFGPGPASQPAVAADAAGRVWIAWEDQGAGERDILVARSADSGGSWSAPRRVDTDEAGSASSFHPTLVSDGDAVVVAWWDLRSGLADVYVRRMDGDRAADGSDGPEVRLDPGVPGGASSHEASLARLPSGALRVTWREGLGSAPFLARESRDGGRSWDAAAPWAAPAPASASPAAILSETEVIAPDGSRHRVRVSPVPGRLEYERAP